jgi:superfamily II DNA or RNA helicase
MDFASFVQDNTVLRPHQIEAKAKIFDAWSKYDSVMLQMPTGTGKTYLFTSLINDIINTYKLAHKDIKILIVAHRTELLDQISATLNKFGISHGFIQGAREQYLWKRVQVGSIMSLLTDKNYYNVCRQKFDYIIVDEAHHSLADTYIRLFGLFPNAKKLGVTATPWRLNHESFLSLYQYLIVSPQISWFINNNLLSDFDYVSIKQDSEVQKLVDRSEVVSTGDFSNADLDNTFNNQRIRSKLYESYLQFANGRKGIIYAINKCHAAKIAELYSSHGVKAMAIDCDTPRDVRQEMITAFKNGEISVLVNVDIFTEGFDCPDVNFIQLARPTKSLSLYLQQVGRGLRIVEGKEKTIILDNVGLYNYFGLPDANRKWQYHFEGHEDVEHICRSSQDRDSLGMAEFEFAESKFSEDDEQMVVVRGATTSMSNSKQECQEQKKMPIIQDVSLCDYYLIIGHRKRFKIYPFIKKRGKVTDSVGNCVFEYDEAIKKVEFTEDAKQNLQELEGNIKLQSIITFAAMLANIKITDVVNINKLQEMSDSEKKSSESIFDVFDMISKIYQRDKLAR